MTGKAIFKYPNQVYLQRFQYGQFENSEQKSINTLLMFSLVLYRYHQTS